MRIIGISSSTVTKLLPILLGTTIIIYMETGQFNCVCLQFQLIGNFFSSRSSHRLILFVGLMTFLGWSLDLILLAWAAFTLNPIYVSLSSNDYPIGNVPFPGISICPNNKLSKSAAQSYAQLL